MRRVCGRWVPALLVPALLGLALLIGGCSKASKSQTPSEVTRELGMVVELVQDQGSRPEKCELKRSTGVDHVRWHNPTTVERKVYFTGPWPFIGPQADIIIPAGKWSPWFTLNETFNGDCPYKVDPPLIDPSKPPGEPVVSVGG